MGFRDRVPVLNGRSNQKPGQVRPTVENMGLISGERCTGRRVNGLGSIPRGPATLEDT